MAAPAIHGLRRSRQALLDLTPFQRQKEPFFPRALRMDCIWCLHTLSVLPAKLLRHAYSIANAVTDISDVVHLLPRRALHLDFIVQAFAEQCAGQW